MRWEPRHEQYKRAQTELYTGIQTVTDCQVLRKCLRLEAYKLSIVQGVDLQTRPTNITIALGI
jgi:hypothetical protein